MPPTPPEQEIEAGEPTRWDVELVEQLGGARVSTAPSGAQPDVTPVVEQTVRDVLGYVPRTTDPQGFVAALTRSYQITEIEGVEQLTWTPRGYAIQADLGEVTGAQASIYTRAQEALSAVRPLVEGITPLVVDVDPEAAEASRRIVLYSFSQIVNELGSEGGPSVRFIDDLWIALLGNRAKPINPPGPPQGPPTSPDQVQGQLGDFRERFALFRRYVNLVEEEQNYTNFVILVDYISSLYQSWYYQRSFFLSAAGTEPPFFGTQLVLLSRALDVVNETTGDVNDALDAVMIGKAERQLLHVDVGGSPMFLDGLLEWISRFAQNDAPTLIQEAGRNGAISLQPALNTMAEATAAFVPPRRQKAFEAQLPGFPPLYNTPLVAAALSSLYRGLEKARGLVGDLGVPQAVYRGVDVREPSGVGVAAGEPAPKVISKKFVPMKRNVRLRGTVKGLGFKAEGLRVVVLDEDDDEVAIGKIVSLTKAEDLQTLVFDLKIKALQPGTYSVVLEQDNVAVYLKQLTKR
jgi:hypothetical protein